MQKPLPKPDDDIAVGGNDDEMGDNILDLESDSEEGEGSRDREDQGAVET